MLPRLQAEENLSAIDIGLLSSGYADRKDVAKAVARLERVANGGRRRGSRPTPETLAAAGIEMVIIEAPAGTSEPNDG
jgi:hypothetical protein